MDTLLPDLRIVLTQSLIPHEQADRQRSVPLAERLRAEGMLKNPPIVAELGEGDERFVILDGANRYTATSVLGIPHILAQVVDYEDPRLQLTTWYHAVTDCPPELFDSVLNCLPELHHEQTTLIHARASLARREILAYVVRPDERVDMLTAAGDLRKRTAVLNAIVDTYKSSGRLHRVTVDRASEVGKAYANLTAIVVFPHYEPAEIIELAREGVRLPAGITRHIVPQRAMRLNYPLDKLSAPGSLADKNAELQAWLHAKLANREIRAYDEPTVLFDE